MKNMNKIIQEIISKRDPFGYYVILAANNVEVKFILEKFKYKGLILDEIGSLLIIRCKSRRIAEKLIRLLALKNLLVFQNP
ncbi:MAG: hypothetical protein QW775_05870 [Ignisphaera sp.]|uniref:Uncharacterized protein n=1 Tax=Ignisphaera aggregans TaxID=334771 RepID=A0A832FR12_9CREN